MYVFITCIHYLYISSDLNIQTRTSRPAAYRSCLAVLPLRGGLHQDRGDHAHHLWGGDRVLRNHLGVLKVPGLSRRGRGERERVEWLNDVCNSYLVTYSDYVLDDREYTRHTKQYTCANFHVMSKIVCWLACRQLSSHHLPMVLMLLLH